MVTVSSAKSCNQQRPLRSASAISGAICPSDTSTRLGDKVPATRSRSCSAAVDRSDRRAPPALEEGSECPSERVAFRRAGRWGAMSDSVTNRRRRGDGVELTAMLSVEDEAGPGVISRTVRRKPDRPSRLEHRLSGSADLSRFECLFRLSQIVRLCERLAAVCFRVKKRRQSFCEN